VFTEDELLPISALQHLVFCERQCALIHLEQVWQENRLTVEGRLMHERVDTRLPESRGRVRIAFGLSLQSLRLGLTGRADVVEFHEAEGEDIVRHGIEQPVSRACPFPVEYKRGKPKSDRCDEVQLCAQALCIEEMLGVSVPRGALFYRTIRRRREICFDNALRSETEDAARKLHELIDGQATPMARQGPHCRSCSLRQTCLPVLPTLKRSATRYLEEAIESAERS